MKDSEAKTIFRILILILFSTGSAYLYFSHSSQKFLHVFVAWLLFLFIIGLYWYYIYLKVYENFLLILKMVQGKIKKGSYIFAVPHRIRFLYSDKPCQISHSVDWKLDHLIEYSFALNKEIEMIVIRKKPKAKDSQEIQNKFIIAGEDKAAFNLWMNEPGIKSAFEDLMRDFSHLRLGKDSQIRLSERYDSYLTKPKTAMQILDKMIILASFLEEKIIK